MLVGHVRMGVSVLILRARSPVPVHLAIPEPRVTAVSNVVTLTVISVQF